MWGNSLRKAIVRYYVDLFLDDILRAVEPVLSKRGWVLGNAGVAVCNDLVYSVTEAIVKTLFLETRHLSVNVGLFADDDEIIVAVNSFMKFLHNLFPPQKLAKMAVSFVKTLPKCV